MPSSPSRLPAASAGLLGRTARAVLAADKPEDALAAVLVALRSSVGGSEVVLLKTLAPSRQLVPLACDGLALAPEPTDEAALARLGLTGYPLVTGGCVEGLVLVRDRSPRWLAARRARLSPLLDLVAQALRNVRLAGKSRLAEADYARLSAQKREAFLAEASRRLASSLDYEATLREVAPLAVPFLADYCLVYLTNSGGESRLVAVAHVDPTKEALLRTLHHRYAGDHLTVGGVAQVVRTGESVLYPENTDAEYRARGRDAEHVAMLQTLGSRSAMIVPLAARERTFGAMSFVQSVSGRGFAPDDLTLAEDLARRCAQAIDNARLYQAAQREIAERTRMEVERARLLQQIEQERATIAGVTGSMSDGLLLLDAEGRTIYCNARAGELYGLEPGLIVGQASQVAFSRTRHMYADPDAAALLWRDALSKIEHQPRFDVVLAGPNARRVQVRVFPVPGDPSCGGQVGVLLQDVTAERELQSARNDLVSMVSHEIASPATSLVACAELLASTATVLAPAERQEMLASMVAEGHRLMASIGDFLDIQRLENQRMRIQLRPSDLRPLVEHAATIARTDTDHHLEVDLPEWLPLVEVDPDRVQQVLTNLLSNARKYTPAGREIRLAARVVGAAVEVSVADDGLGIPVEALPHLFDKFYRIAGPERRAIKGTGLGLAIAKELVETQGGRIGVESAGPGRGSRFWFSVPIASSAAPMAPAEQLGRPQPAGQRPGAQMPSPHGLRVLIVDDDPVVGSTATRVLRPAGHRVTIALSAEEALRDLETAPFDIVVSDLGLGAGLNGRELASRVRERWPRVHFLLATGSVGIVEADARADGVEAILQKPYRPQELRDLITHLSSGAATREAA